MFEMFCTLVEEHCSSSCGDTASSVVALVQNALGSTNTAIVQKSLKLWQSIDKRRLSKSQLEAIDRLASQHLDVPPHTASSGEGTWPRPKSSITTASTTSRSTALSSPLHKKAALGSAVGPTSERVATGTPHRTRSSTTSLLLADDAEFVAISSPTVGQKRVLTPHQREKLQERRCDIPALYSDLSQQASQSFSETSVSASQEEDSADQKLARTSGARRSLEVMNGSTSRELRSTADVRSDCHALSADSPSQADGAPRSKSPQNEDATAGQDGSEMLATSGNAEIISTCTSQVGDQSVSNDSALNVQKQNTKILIPSKLSSEAEIPHSQASDSNVNNFSGRTRQVLGSFGSIPRVIPNIDGIEPLGGAVEQVTTDDVTVETGGDESHLSSVEAIDNLHEDSSTALQSSVISHTTKLDTEQCWLETSSAASYSATKSTRENLVVVSEPVQLTDDRHELPQLKGVDCSFKMDDKMSETSLNTTPSKVTGKSVEVLATPSKITRSGRKIVPPKKGMPEPMTPPGSSFSAKKSGTSKAVLGTPCDVLKTIDSSKSIKRIEVAVSPGQGVSEHQESGYSEGKPVGKSVQKRINEMFAVKTDLPANSCCANVSIDIGSNKDDEIFPVLNKAETPQNYSRRSRKNRAEIAFESLELKLDSKNKASEVQAKISMDTSVKAIQDFGQDTFENGTGSSCKTDQKSEAENNPEHTDILHESTPSAKVSPVIPAPGPNESVPSTNTVCQVKEQELPSKYTNPEKSDICERFRRGKRTRKSAANHLSSCNEKNKPMHSTSSEQNVNNDKQEKKKSEDSASCFALCSSDEEPLVKKLRDPKESSNHKTFSESGKHFSENEDSIPKINQGFLQNDIFDSQFEKCTQSQSSLSTSSNKTPSLLNTHCVQTFDNNESANVLREENKRGCKRRRDFSDERDASVKRRNTRSQHDLASSNVKLNDYVSMRRGTKRKMHGSNAEPIYGSESTSEPGSPRDSNKIPPIGCNDNCKEKKSSILKDVSAEGVEILVSDDSSKVPFTDVLPNTQEEISAKKADGCLSSSDIPKHIDAVSNNCAEVVMGEASRAEDEHVSRSVADEVTCTVCPVGLLHDSDHTSEPDEVNMLRVSSEKTNDSDNINKVSNAGVMPHDSAHQDEPQFQRKEKEEVQGSDVLCGKDSSINVDGANDQPEILASPHVERSSDNTATPPSNSRDTEPSLDKRRSASVQIKCSRSGSRAAFMVACAQSKMVANSPSATFTPTRPGKGSPPVSECGGERARCTPPAGRRPRLSSTPRSTQLWPRHRQSPAASPSGSILKKPLVDSGSKGRRVSFADPPVSKSVVIVDEEPADGAELCLSPRGRPVPLSVRAQKRLDMSRASASSPVQLAHHSKLTKLVHPSTLPQQPSLASLAQLVKRGKDDAKCGDAIYGRLASCSASVSCLLSSLTSPALSASLEAVLRNRAVTTVGQVASFTEEDLAALPIKPPKLQTTVGALRRYESTLTDASDDSTGKDSSESELWELTREGSHDAPVTEVGEATLPQDVATDVLPSAALVSCDTSSPHRKVSSSFEEQAPMNGETDLLLKNDTTELTKNDASDTCEENFSEKETDKALIENLSKPSENLLVSRKSNAFVSDECEIPFTQNDVSGSSNVPSDETHVLQSSTSEVLGECIHGNSTEMLSNEKNASVSTISPQCETMSNATAVEPEDNAQSEGLQDNNSDKENSSPERCTSSEGGLNLSGATPSLTAPEEARVAFVLQRSEGQRRVLAEIPVGLDHESDEEDEETSSCDQLSSKRTSSTSALGENMDQKDVRDAATEERSCGNPEAIVAAVKAMSPGEQDAVLAALLPALQYTQVLDAFTHYLRRRE